MAFARAWRRSAAAGCWLHGGQRAANVCRRDRTIPQEPTHSRITMGRGLVTLKTRADFLRVAATNRRAVTEGLILQAALRPHELGCEAPVRVGFTASRKVGNAVTRNRAKRRLRGLAASVLSGKGEPGTDYVLIARASTAGRPYVTLVTDLQAALRRLNRRGLTTRTGAA
jgi:ribonuclease P protein component